MKKILFFTLLSILMIGCSQEEVGNGGNVAPTGNEQTTLFALKRLPETTRATAENSYLWNKGQTIRIKFLNGTETEKSRVQEYAAEWLNYAGLEFEYVDASDVADVKIAFNWNDEKISWSYLGTEAKIIRQHQPSMNFGDLSPMDDIARQQVLVEFGHMLGLLNEHYNPNVSIQWNRDKVYQYYQDIAGWNRGDVDQFFFANYNTANMEYTDFDDRSIMVWPIERLFTQDAFCLSRNYQLSVRDKELIAKLYPKAMMTLAVSSYAGEYEEDDDDSYFCYGFYLTAKGNNVVYYVDWGDGIIERVSGEFDEGQLHHEYLNHSKGKIYTIKLYGDSKGITELSTVHLGSQVVSLDIRQLTNLIYLRCNEQNIPALDVSCNPLLESLSCGSGRLTTLDLSNNHKLRTLSCEENKLAELNLSNNPFLEDIHCDENLLTNLDFSNNLNLKFVVCSDNQLSNLIVNKNLQLDYLSCRNNMLEVLLLPNSKDLKELDISENPLINNEIEIVRLANSLPQRNKEDEYYSRSLGLWNETAKGWAESICKSKGWSIR